MVLALGAEEPPFDDGDGALEGGSIALGNIREERLECRDPARAAGHEDLAASVRRRDALGASIVGIGGPRDEAVRFEARDEARHRRRGHALVAGELADRARAAEDEHREGRQAGRALAARAVLAGKAPEQVEDGGVESGRELLLA